MQISAIASLVFVFVCNFVLGFLPYVDNFASIGGFISGFLLGSVFLLSPQLQPVAPNKGGLIDYGVKSCIKLKLKQKLDRPVLRIVSLILFSLLYVVFSSCFYSLIYFNLHGQLSSITRALWHASNLQMITLLLFVDWLVVLWLFFMESTSAVIAHGVHMSTVSLLQAGTAKTQKPLVRYIQLTSGISQIKNSQIKYLSLR